MARAAIAIQTASEDGTELAAGTSINGTGASGGYIAAGGDTSKLLILAANASGGALNFTLIAGDSSPAFRTGLGDKVVAVANNKTEAIVVESARIAQSDGQLYVDTSGALTITALRLP